MYTYKRAGVVLSQIRPVKALAPTLFDDLEAERENTLRSRNLMKAIDRLNRGVGPSIVKLATELSKGHIGHNDGYSSSFGPAKKFSAQCRRCCIIKKFILTSLVSSHTIKIRN